MAHVLRDSTNTNISAMGNRGPQITLLQPSTHRKPNRQPSQAMSRFNTRVTSTSDLTFEFDTQSFRESALIPAPRPPRSVTNTILSIDTLSADSELESGEYTPGFLSPSFLASLDYLARALEKMHISGRPYRVDHRRSNSIFHGSSIEWTAVKSKHCGRTLPRSTYECQTGSQQFEAERRDAIYTNSRGPLNSEGSLIALNDTNVGARIEDITSPLTGVSMRDMDEALAASDERATLEHQLEVDDGEVEYLIGCLVDEMEDTEERFNDAEVEYQIGCLVDDLEEDKNRQSDQLNDSDEEVDYLINCLIGDLEEDEDRRLKQCNDTEVDSLIANTLYTSGADKDQHSSLLNDEEIDYLIGCLVDEMEGDGNLRHSWINDAEIDNLISSTLDDT